MEQLFCGMAAGVGAGARGISNHFGRGSSQMGVGVGVKWTNWVPEQHQTTNSNKKATWIKQMKKKQNQILLYDHINGIDLAKRPKRKTNRWASEWVSELASERASKWVTEIDG